MQQLPIKVFFSLWFGQKSHRRFAVGVSLGLAFSIAVILCTVGVMDGFEHSLKKGLRLAQGDVMMASRDGFFQFDKEVKSQLTKLGVQTVSPGIQSESFLIFNETSHGVLIKGIEPKSYSSIVGMTFKLGFGRVAVGSEIAKKFGLKIGTEVILAFASGNSQINGLPDLRRFKVSQIIEHGVYQKDSRLVYLLSDELQSILNVEKKINIVSFNVPKNLSHGDDIAQIENFIYLLQSHFVRNYFFRPYWRDFSSLIEAVQVEKVMISLVLQLIVVISIFNVLAFIIFINEKKSKEFFLFKALGMSQKHFSRMWWTFILSMWATGCFISVIFLYLFKWFIEKGNMITLPSNVYYLGKLEVLVDAKDYAIVFFIALIWIGIMGAVLLRRLNRSNILEGLRKEFA